MCGIVRSIVHCFKTHPDERPLTENYNRNYFPFRRISFRELSLFNSYLNVFVRKGGTRFSVIDLSRILSRCERDYLIEHGIRNAIPK